MAFFKRDKLKAEPSLFLTESLMHKGVSKKDGAPVGSGRYPLGSGENPYQHEEGFNVTVNSLKKQGIPEKEIANMYGLTIRQLRDKVSIAKEEQKRANIAQVYRYVQKGYSNRAISEAMGVSGSTIRSWRKAALEEKTNTIDNISTILRDNVKDKKYIDVGPGVERELGVSREKLRASISKLKEEGYVEHKVYVDQAGISGNKTTISVLCPSGTQWADVAKNMGDIKTITDYSKDNGKTWLGLEPPKSISSDRIKVNYKEDGGEQKDGVLEIRRGVPDISLGDSRYAQVRVAVDGTHYMKGMAVYSDNMPDGVDIIFNTNKSKESAPNKIDVFKPMQMDKKTGKIDKDNPFGATIKPQGQVHYIDENGKDHLGVMNIVNEEGDWSGWKNSLSSQMLSKQDTKLAKQQLDIAYERKKNEYETISSLTNPMVKKKLLEAFSDNCDADSVHLKAAALPRQSSQVILPISSLKDNEIYAPRYKDGETVALIRHPHGGIFEIPVLKVNNRNKEGKSVITPQAIDAVGINKSVADRLSGADFDGDSVIVIPISEQVRIRTAPPLEGLKDFDPKEAYPGYPGMKTMSNKLKQTEMGKVSNLITDMTLKGADVDEIARAVRHSMVVIDAEKHGLNYKQSEKDNGIKELKQKYQGGGGASTLISRASSDVRVPERKREYKINPETGEKIFSTTGKTYSDKDGNIKVRMTKTTRMAEVSDAHDLSSGTRMEYIYAEYANKMKAMANQSRKDILNIKPNPSNTSAKRTYSKEVESLNAKLDIALRNAPRERQAQIFANEVVKAKKRDNPELKEDKDRLKKVKTQALNNARSMMGATPRRERKIDITDKEWEAIQAGAISSSRLSQIIDNTDLDELKELSMPRASKTMTSAKVARAKQLSNNGYTIAQIADILGVSTSTVSSAINN